MQSINNMHTSLEHSTNVGIAVRLGANGTADDTVVVAVGPTVVLVLVMLEVGDTGPPGFDFRTTVSLCDSLR